MPSIDENRQIDWGKTIETLKGYEYANESHPEKKMWLKIERDSDGKEYLVAKDKSEMGIWDRIKASFGFGEWKLSNVLDLLQQANKFDTEQLKKHGISSDLSDKINAKLKNISEVYNKAWFRFQKAEAPTLTKMVYAEAPTLTKMVDKEVENACEKLLEAQEKKGKPLFEESIGALDKLKNLDEETHRRMLYEKGYKDVVDKTIQALTTLNEKIKEEVSKLAVTDIETRADYLILLKEIYERVCQHNVEKLGIPNRGGSHYYDLVNLHNSLVDNMEKLYSETQAAISKNILQWVDVPREKSDKVAEQLAQYRQWAAPPPPSF